MTTGTIKTQGTRLFFVIGANTSDEAIHQVVCPTGITGVGAGAGSQIDKSCLSSLEKEFERGMLSPGAIPVPINFIPRSAAHQALIALRASGATVDWMLVFSDQTGSPSTTDSSGYLVSPGETTVRWQGYLADAGLDFAMDSIAKGNLSIQRTGAPVWDFPTADLD